MSADKSAPTTTDSAWGLRYPGLVVGKGGRNEVMEFTGMWPLKPDTDLVAFTDTLSREAPVWKGPGKTFSEGTTKLGLIRTARWFVVRTPDFKGYTLFFISQFDGSLSKYFDDFILNGKEVLSGVWGHCVGCPSGPDATARDIVEYIAQGQIKTLAVYDVAPSVSITQIYKGADWYEKTQKFQRAVAAGEGSLEDKVNAFFKELAEPYKPVVSGAQIDTDVARQWQYEDVAERLQNFMAAKSQRSAA